MLILTPLLAALTNSFARAEEVYLEVKDQRVPTFSDQVVPGASPIITCKLSIFKDMTHQKSQLKQRCDDSLTPMIIGYRLLVTNPLNDSVTLKNAGTLNLTISISTSIQLRHGAKIIISGNKICDI